MFSTRLFEEMATLFRWVVGILLVGALGVGLLVGYLLS